MNPHKTNREIAEENSNIPYPKIMKYRSKNGFEGTFEMCEMLTYCKEGNPPKKCYVYTPDGCAHKYPQFLESQITNTDLFEPIEVKIDRIKLATSQLTLSDQGIEKSNGERVTSKDLCLWEKASNGELFSKEALKAFGLTVFNRPPESGESWTAYFNDWLEDREVSK